jgi:hypothetical protein
MIVHLSSDECSTLGSDHLSTIPSIESGHNAIIARSSIKTVSMIGQLRATQR